MKRGVILTTGRIVLSVAGIMFILTGILWIGAEVWVSGRISKLMNEPFNMNGESYSVSVRRVRVSFIRRTAMVSGIEIVSQPNRKGGADPVVAVRIDGVEAVGISVGGRRGRKITIEKIIVEMPDILYEGVPKPDEKKTVADKVPSPSREIEIGELQIIGGSVRGGMWTGDGKECFAAGNVNIHVSEIEVRKALNEMYAEWLQGRGTLIGGKFEFSADSLKFSYENGAMCVLMAGIEGGSDGNAKIGTLRLEPQYAKEIFSLRDVRHKDWMCVEIVGIECSGMAFPVAGYGRELRIDSAGINRLGINSFKDRNQPQNGSPKLTFYEMLNRLPIGMEIGKVVISDAGIVYEEISEGARDAGVVSLDEMEIRINNVKVERGGDTAGYRVVASGKIFGTAFFDSDLLIVADSSGGRFEMRTRCGPMRAAVAGGTAEAIAGIRIVSGEIESAEVLITGDYTEAHSQVRIRYEDLEIAIMRRGGGQRERKMLSAIANDFVLRRDNPEQDRFREGEGTCRRDPYKSFWNYLWRTSLAGIMDVLI